ncbi:MAG: DNA gyrase subunit A [Elusimicrobia bacterium]|jgi:DNA gyrase subunit A|nr:DNA gyrase subunit A [Elusimicrobiota bacterium]
MAKNDNKELIKDQYLENQNIEDEMKTCYIDYAMSVIVGRALPDVRDGLKPVHRRILYAMNDMSLYYNKSYKKCARIVGEVLGKYHPHGDQAVYNSMVRMVQDFSMRSPLLDGQGNYGSVDGDSAAAMRYTEIRMQKISDEMMRDINKETVDFTPNFDGSLEEPTVLPANVPNLLVNGSSGIAVGMATSIPPHNLKEVSEGLLNLIANPDITIDELMESIKAPDFPTGAEICGLSGAKQAYHTGRGSVKIRAKVIQEELKRNKVALIVKEIPYLTNKAKTIEHIAQLVKDKKIEGITDLRDESSREGIRIRIELSQNANPEVVLNQLYNHSRLQSTFGITMISIVDGQPRLLNLKQMLEYYLAHRRVIIRRSTKYDLKKAEARAHIVEGLRIALENIDEIVKIIKKSSDREDAEKKLIAKYSLSEIQSKAILDMRLHRLTSLEMDKLEEEYKELIKEIERCKAILKSPKKVENIIKKQIKEVSDSFGTERVTEIGMSLDDLEKSDLIKEEEMVVTMSNTGYIKRLPLTTYKAQRRGGRGKKGMATKEDDFLEDLFITSTHSYMLFFTNQGNVYWMKVYNLPSASRNAKGKAVVNLLRLERDEKITAMIAVRDFEKVKDNYLIMSTAKGIVKKSKLEAYSRPRKGGIIAVNLDEDDRLISVKQTCGDDEIILTTLKGKAIRFSEKDVRSIGRTGRGVKGINLADSDRVVGMEVIEDEGESLLTACKNGYGKRTPIENYRLQKRGGKGIINIKASKRNGEVVSVRKVDIKDEIMLITQNGIINRQKVTGIRSIGRNTQGVRLLKLDKDDRLVSVARIAREDIVEEN